MNGTRSNNRELTLALQKYVYKHVLYGAIAELIKYIRIHTYTFFLILIDVMGLVYFLDR